MMFTDAVDQIKRASTFAALGEGEATYKAYAKIVHPDAVSEADNATATWAFAALSKLYHERSRLVASGDIADLSAGDDGQLIKVPREPGDNDLMEAEADALRTLREKGDPKYRPYVARLLDTYLHEDEARKRRRVNVIRRLDGFVPLSVVGKRDPRDVAWIWRRLLVGLGWAHQAGVIHGAVLEDHVLIHPGEHGLALVDWCYSGASVKAIVAARKDDYPPEVRNDKRATPATDIYMATALMVRLMDDPPAPLTRFAQGCLYDKPRMRPQDAWRLLHELDETLHSLYGPRKFRPFTV
ncbi:molecular chaperone DnaJ [Actinoplanes bogorensis]|uniref:Molecular chaperone DnaJ n=1 Tax=Paractinoplanes bogorensis TaxID=1610840 RepID=A0ABS5YSL3_9ACTN|nr:molecular chaperone DnaJ [Actinoplanes bogorensis]MBU2666446.1 molecular chaperone DnaJ [Actinoplanes bogorensis]